MTLNSPFIIGPRLLPCLKIGDAFLSLEYAGEDDGRMLFRWFIDMPAGEFTQADLRSGAQGATLQQMFGTLLAFLGASAEAYSYTMRTGRDSDNADLFPPAISEWAYQNYDDISMLQAEIEDGPDLIDE